MYLEPYTNLEKRFDLKLSKNYRFRIHETREKLSHRLEMQQLWN
jgi:hypothetical protein